jgi:hypothetical protein
LRLAFVTLLLCVCAPARADGDLAADVVAITDDAVFIDVFGKTPKGPQLGWLVLNRRDASVHRYWRELPKGLGRADCDGAMNDFSKALEQFDVGGVRLDARQCGRNDISAWAASQPVLNGGELKGRYVTSLTLERLRATRSAFGFGSFVGTKWTARFTGKFVNVMRDGQSYASMPTGLSPPTPAAGWVVVAPSGGMACAFDSDFGGFQMWQREGGRWKSVLLVNALDME